jgi:hypothetical protein
VYKNFINAVELVTTRPEAKGDIAMDDRRVFDNRGANHGFPIKREILPPNRESINDSWFRKRLDFVRRSSKKDLLTKIVHTELEK